MVGHEIIGNGPLKVLVLHGWFGGSSSFAACFEALDRENFTYCLMDYRGYGRSRGMAGEFSLDEIARDAIALCDHLGWERFSTVGHSMGGTASQKLAVIAGGRVAASACVTPVPPSGVPMEGDQRDLFFSASKLDTARETIIDFSTGNRLSASWIQAMVRKSREDSDDLAFAAYLEAWSKSDFSADVAGMEHPVRAYIGEHDLALTADVMEATYRQFYRRFSLEVLPNAGHYPMIETPIWLVATLEKFLTEAAAQ